MSGDTPMPQDQLSGRIGGYDVVGLLGRGGMASVYLVRDVHLGVLRALKVLEVARASLRQRLLEEGRAQARLEHPDIVRVFGVVELGVGLGLVMEYVDGPSLEEMLDAHRLDAAQIDHVMVHVLRGVAHAHAHGLVHRDLKPGNILLRRGIRDFEPRIADFGLVKTLDADVNMRATRSGMSLGTPAYMAPEQTRDAREADERADVWALGVLAYRLVANELPFQGDDPVDLQLLVRTGEHVDIHERMPEVPDRIADAIRGALQVDRDDRTASVEDFARTWFDGRELAEVQPEVGVWPPELLSSFQRVLLSEPAQMGRAVAVSHPTLGGVVAPGMEDFSRPTGPTIHAEDLLPPLEPLPVRAPAPPPRSSASPAWALGFLAAGLLTAVVLLAAVRTAASVPTSAPDPLERRAAAPVTPPPEVPPEAEVVPTVEAVVDEPAAPPPEPAPRERVPTPRRAAPASAAPEPARGASEAPADPPPVAVVATTASPPSPPVPSTASLSVAPASLKVFLSAQGSSATFRPGAAIPVGTYDVVAYFGDDPTRVATLDLAAGDRVDLACQPAFRMCKVTR